MTCYSCTPTLSWSARRIAATLFLVGSFTAGKANAQSPVRIEAQGTTAVLINDLPVRLAVLYRVDDDSVVWHMGIQSIAGRSSIELRDSNKHAALQRIEPLASIGLRTRTPAACRRSEDPDLQTEIARLETLAHAPSLEGSREADDAIETATQLAQLRLERTRDSLDSERHSMVALAARLQTTSSMSPSQLAQQEDKDQEESRDETIETIGFAALAYSEAAAAKYEVLSRDAERFHTLLENSESALAMVHRRVEMIRQQVNATAEFEHLVSSSIATSASSEQTAAFNFSNAVVRRTCTTPAAVDDQILVTGISSDATSALSAEVRYDTGERQAVVLRLVSGTSDWLGTIAWPVGATRGALQVQSANRQSATIKGSLEAGRSSLRANEETLKRNVIKARQRYKEALFRSRGADHIKTVIVP